VRYFGKRFAEVRKELKLDPDQTIYSLRHTFALDLFNSFMKEGNTEKEAILKILPITRHKNESGLRNYLRNIGGFVAKDYSNRYSLNF